MRPLTLVDLRYQQNNRRAPQRLGKQVAYIARSAPAWRRAGIAPVPLFNRTLDTLHPAAARALLAAHGLAPHWPGPVAYHRLILSARPGLDLALDVAAVRVLVSVALDDLGVLLDRRLVWVGGVHVDTAHRHVHALIAGGDRGGRPVEIRGRALAAFKARVEVRARVLAG